MGVVPLIQDTGKFRRINADCDLPGVLLTMDADNLVGVGATVRLLANQGVDLAGELRYNASTDRWEISDNGGTFFAPLSPLGRSGGQTLIGGTGVTDTLTLRSTSGVGAVGADIVFQVGNNGGTEAVRILNSGSVGIGASPGEVFHVNIGAGKARFAGTANTSFGQVQIGNSLNGGEVAIGFISGVTAYGTAPTSTNGDSHIWAFGPGTGGITGAKFGLFNKNLGANAIVVQADGSVGLGTSLPGCTLDVTGSFRATVDARVGGKLGVSQATLNRLLNVGSNGAGGASIWAGSDAWGEGLRLIASSSSSYCALFIGSGTDADSGMEWAFGRHNATSGGGARDDLVLTDKDWTGSSLGLTTTDVAVLFDRSTGNAAFGAKVGIGIVAPTGFLHVNVPAAATDNAITLVQAGNADAINIAISHTSGQALVVTESTAGTNPLVSLTRSTAAATGHVISITKAPGSATAGAGVYISWGASASGNPISISTAGGGGAGINVAATGTAGGVYVDKSSGSGGGAGLSAAMGSSCSGNALDISQSGSGYGIYCSCGTNEWFYVDAAAHASINTNTNVNCFDINAGLASGYTSNIFTTNTNMASGSGYNHIRCFSGSSPVFNVRGDGYVTADGTYTSPATDFAEKVLVNQDKALYSPGDVLVVCGNGLFDFSTVARDNCVAGVVSTRPCFLGNSPMAEDQRNVVEMGMLGAVPTKCVTENGSIAPGDLLTTSSTQGRAMKAGNAPRGTILGKALGTLTDDGSGTVIGTVLVYVTLQ